MRQGERWVVVVLVTVLALPLGGFALLVGGLFAVHGCLIWHPAESGAVRAITGLEQGIAALPGVLESDVDVTASSCGANLRANVTMRATAGPDEVGAAARRVAEALHLPELEGVGISSTFRFDNAALRGALQEGLLGMDGQARALPVELVVAEARAWALLHARYPGTSVWLADGPAVRHVFVRLIDEAAPGAVSEAFRVLAASPFPPRGGMTWEVRAFREYEYPSVDYGTSYSTPGIVPPDEVLAAMEGVAGWPALLARQDDMSAEVAWVVPSGYDAPPHLSVDLDLELEELRYTPGNRVASAAPASSAPRLAADFLDRLETTGLHYSLVVRLFSADPPFVEQVSWEG